MVALLYIIDTLFSLYIGLYLLRLLMQMVRADFRNQVGAAIVSLTNPLIMPLRRVLPPVGKFDSATIVAIVVLTAAKIAVIRAVGNIPFPSPLGWITVVTLDMIVALLWVLFICILLSAIMGFVMQGARTVISNLLDSISEPVLRPFRRHIPSLAGGFDLSYLWASIAIQALIILINTSIAPRIL
jgi:YggT family protein